MPLGIQMFREDKGGDLATLRASETARNVKPELVDNVIAADSEWRKVEFEVNQLNKQLNALSKEIGAKKKAKENADELVAQVGKSKEELKAKEEKLKELERAVVVKLRMVGNLVHSSVPLSKDEKDNVIVKTVGECKRDHAKYHHHELLHMIDGYSAERGANVAGHRGYFLKGVGVLLNQALIQYGLTFLTKRQYTPLQPPYFMKKDIMAETAQLEEFDEALYHVTGSGEEKDFYLIATSEQPISAYHRNEWLEPSELPLRYGGISTCFRKEAGSYGRDAWGIFRIHQFEKIEQFCITAPEESWAMHEEMIKTCEDFYQSLGLSYQIVNIVSGALNNAASKKYDLEAWFPTLGVYRELVSASNCTDYQSRAMETRFGQKKAGQTEKSYVHMLNATLCATERTICCLLENYQTAEGVVVPEVLRPFMGGIELMKFVKPPPKASETAEKTRNAAAPAAATSSSSAAAPKQDAKSDQ